MIKYVEATPDTILTLNNNEKIMVQESVHNILDATLQYKRQVHAFPEVEASNDMHSPATVPPRQ